MLETNSNRKLVISDLHGCVKTFKHMIEEVLKLSHSDVLYLLGDFVDRGPDTKGVIDYVMDLQKEFDIRATLGNHEELMVNAKINEANHSHWLKSGGKETLDSFGVSHVNDIPQEYWDFIDSLEYYFEEEEAYLVHAGFNDKNPFGDKEAMLWIRNFYIDSEKMKGKKVVHGHTPHQIHSIISNVQAGNDDICIDAGCVFGLKDGLYYGHLACLNLDTWDVLYIDRMD